MRLSRSFAVAAVGVAIAVGVPAGWSVLGRPAGAGPFHAPRPASRIAAPAAPAGPRVAVSAPGGARETPPLPLPIRIEIPSLSIGARVVAEGVGPDGQMAIPTDIAAVGWYRWGPAPGAPAGSVVLVGHVDSAVQGRGAFFSLTQIRRGARVVVRTAGGRTWSYRVVAREQFRKTVVPLDAIFARTGPTRLTLVTCGGRFNRATRSYLDNIVVTALPA